MKLKEFLNKKISYESMEKFMDSIDIILGYLLYITGLILVITLLI